MHPSDATPRLSKQLFPNQLLVLLLDCRVYSLPGVLLFTELLVVPPGPEGKTIGESEHNQWLVFVQIGTSLADLRSITSLLTFKKSPSLLKN